ncbi:sorting nexin-16-like [Centropristis striata]|uniref:sorting nexin-16-like n=1 Tax=Centropristis striata TaxID=184440 RepID=UPI0027E16876|nr:sorting nexin-16-like [Centropristis striata]XP_059200749.1 sorting nexin-16-like [Centropristis striata]XP_059200750.1 sorting nexin-16-like [Centropristis striata]
MCLLFVMMQLKYQEARLCTAQIGKHSSGSDQQGQFDMAAPFVPVPSPVNWTGACRSRTKRSPIQSTSSVTCEPSPLGSISGVTGVGPSGVEVQAPTPYDPWSGSRGDVLDGSSTLLEGERSLGDSWGERPIAPILLGYEILEERAKFTVYKILVTGSQGDSWVVFRRYTDFCRLNDKLKELFPSLRLTLPSKSWFKDNYDEDFLEERQNGLQTFLQNLMLHNDIISSEAVRHFLCLVEAPSPFDSLEESRVFCETLEDTNHRLQGELLENQREVDTLKKRLEEKENHISILLDKVKSMSLSSERPRQQTATTATDTNTLTAGDTSAADGFKQKHTDGNEEEDDDR